MAVADSASFTARSHASQGPTRHREPRSTVELGATGNCMVGKGQCGSEKKWWQAIHRLDSGDQIKHLKANFDISVGSQAHKHHTNKRSVTTLLTSASRKTWRQVVLRGCLLNPAEYLSLGPVTADAVKSSAAARLPLISKKGGTETGAGGINRPSQTSVVRTGGKNTWWPKDKKKRFVDISFCCSFGGVNS